MVMLVLGGVVKDVVESAHAREHAGWDAEETCCELVGGSEDVRGEIARACYCWLSVHGGASLDEGEEEERMMET